MKTLNKHLPKILIVLALIVLTIGLIIAWRQYRDNQAADKQSADQQYEANHGHSTGSTPSTNKPKPSAFDNYQVAPDLPRYIFIPKIGVKAIVNQVGLTKYGAIGAPTNIYNTAWYNGSAKPGEPGATLIDGHLDGYNIAGVFWNLHKLAKGDTIKLERGDGKTYNYKIVKTETVANNANISSALKPVVAGKSGLNLITCAGQISKGTHHYDKRIIIYATQAGAS